MIYYNQSDFLLVRKSLFDLHTPLIFTNGCFDIIHAGHVKYLNEAKSLGGRLLVAVNSDQSVHRLKGSSRPFNTLANRMYILSQLLPVDYVVPFYEDTPYSLINLFRPDFLVKGGDYTDASDIVGYDIVRSYGGTVKCLSYTDSLSTTILYRKILDENS